PLLGLPITVGPLNGALRFDIAEVCNSVDATEVCHRLQHQRFCAVLAGERAWLQEEFLFRRFSFLQRDSTCQMIVAVRKNLHSHFSRWKSTDGFAVMVCRSCIFVFDSDHAILGFANHCERSCYFGRWRLWRRWWN